MENVLYDITISNCDPGYELARCPYTQIHLKIIYFGIFHIINIYVKGAILKAEEEWNSVCGLWKCILQYFHFTADWQLRKPLCKQQFTALCGPVKPKKGLWKGCSELVQSQLQTAATTHIDM